MFSQRGALRNHDYSGRCIYHVTLVVSDRLPLLGCLDAQGWRVGEVGRETTDKYNGNHIASKREVPEKWMVRVCYSDLGEEVARKVRAIPSFCRAKGQDVQILAQQCMDTHLHFIIFVKEPLLHATVGDIIRGFKQGCNQVLRQWLARHFPLAHSPHLCSAAPQGSRSAVPQLLSDIAVGHEGRFTAESTAEPVVSIPTIHHPNGASIALTPRILQQHALFEPAYDLTILYHKGQLASVIDYVHSNPWRKWLKQHHHDRFYPQRDVNIAGRSYDAVGNLMLLTLRRRCVHVRRHYTPEERRDYMNACIKEAREGVVLVSPFISPYEASVRDFALKEGHAVIVLTHHEVSDFVTFPEPLLSALLHGQALLLAWPHARNCHPQSGTITRTTCQSLNAEAEAIAADSL